MATSDILNEPPPLVDWNLFTSHRALVEAVRREGAGWAEPALTALGARLGGEEVLDWGVQANRYPPVVHAFDRFGRRRDEVEFPPAWHALLGPVVAEGNMGLFPWREGDQAAIDKYDVLVRHIPKRAPHRDVSCPRRTGPSSRGEVGRQRPRPPADAASACSRRIGARSAGRLDARRHPG